MARTNIILTPNTKKILEKVGNQIKIARLRRNLSVEFMLEQTGISAVTYYAIEKGVATVSIGAYVAVLTVLGLEKDFERVAADEAGKKSFREQNLKRRKRATKIMNEVK